VSHPKVHAASAAQGMWLALIDVAALPDWRVHVDSIAADSGWSNTSIEKRLRAIRWHLDSNILPEVIAEWGAERTVSEWQKETNLNTGKAPGQSVLWSKRVSPELKEALNNSLKAVRSAVGCNDEEALWFIAGLFPSSEPQEILALYQKVSGHRP
jgi:hypothetical protein